MTLEQGKSPEHSSPAASPYQTAPSPFQNPTSIGGGSGEITVPGDQTYDGGAATNVDFSGLANLREKPWSDYRPPASRHEVASEITAPATGETVQTSENTRTSETVGQMATDAATDYATRLRMAIRERDNGRLDTRLTPVERDARELKIRGYLERQPNAYENIIATKIIGRGSKVVLGGSERTTTDNTMTRSVVSVVKALESGNTPEKPQDTTVLVGHLAANTRHRTGLVDAAKDGAFNFFSADIKHAAGLLHALDARDTSSAIAEAIVSPKDSSSSHKTVSDLHKRLTDSARVLLTGGRKPTPVDYRTMLRVVSGEVPENMDTALYRKLVDVFPEKLVEVNKHEVEGLRVFYEELTRDTPREVAAKIESGRYPTSTLFNVGYEGFSTEGQDNFRTMLAAMQGMVSSSTPEGKPDLVVLTNGDRVSQDKVPMVVDLMAECDMQGVPVIFTTGDYVEAHHEPLFIGTKVFGIHRIGTAAAGLISKVSGLNPEVLAENENRSVTGNKGGNTGGGGNTGRGAGDAMPTSSGNNTSYGRTAGMAFGRSQQVRAGTPMMPPHEIESVSDRELGMWGQHVAHPAVYSIDSGLPIGSLPRHQIETLDVDRDIRDVDRAEAPLVGGSHTLGTATPDAPQLERGSERKHDTLRVEATLGDKPVSGATPQLNATEETQSGMAALPIPLPQSHHIGRRSLINQYSGAGNKFPGFRPSGKQLRDLADFGRALYEHQRGRGQTNADWGTWAHHWGVPGHEQKPPENPGTGRRR